MFSRFHEWLVNVGWFVLPAFAGASVVWGWLVWCRLPLKLPQAQSRSLASFIALVAGSISVSIAGFLMLPIWVSGTFLITWCYVGWCMAGLALAFAPFGQGRLRLPTLIIGIIMSLLWWDLWMISHYHAISFWSLAIVPSD